MLDLYDEIVKLLHIYYIHIFHIFRLYIQLIYVLMLVFYILKHRQVLNPMGNN